MSFMQDRSRSSVSGNSSACFHSGQHVAASTRQIFMNVSRAVRDPLATSCKQIYHANTGLQRTNAAPGPVPCIIKQNSVPAERTCKVSPSIGRTLSVDRFSEIHRLVMAVHTDPSASLFWKLILSYETPWTRMTGDSMWSLLFAASMWQSLDCSQRYLNPCRQKGGGGQKGSEDSSCPCRQRGTEEESSCQARAYLVHDNPGPLGV